MKTKVYRYKFLFVASPFPVQWVTSATSKDKAITKARAEIKTHFNMTATTVLESELLSVSEI